MSKKISLISTKKNENSRNRQVNELIGSTEKFKIQPKEEHFGQLIPRVDF